MPSKKNRAVVALAPATRRTRQRRLELSRGRTLAVGRDGHDECIEIRAAGGALELRIRMTEQGPLLQLDGVRLALRAADSIELECKTFSVTASEAVRVASRGTLELRSERELNVDSTEDVRVRGKMIYLN